MTLHLTWLHAPRWLTHVPVNRAMSLVLAVIGVSLLFGALHVLDAAIQGSAIDEPVVPVQPVSAGVPVPASPSRPDAMGSDTGPVDANLVEVPPALAEAISL